MSARPVSTPPDIPGYRHIDLLGMGGFADVFLYEQRSMGGRKVAVKVLLQGLRSDTQLAFEDEARAMARLSNHPSIVSVFDAGQTPDGRAYLVMEHCPGAHLGSQVKNRPLNLAKALEVAIQVAGAVETAHAAGIVHRDIKPANILFTEFNRPALTDFGISASTTSNQGKAVGVSVPWAPPEQLAAGSQTGVTGDVYSLGATLYTALAGHPPFWKAQGPNDNMSMSSRIVNDLLPPIHRDEAPPSLQRVLEVAMAKRPSQRYPTALEFARALQQVQLELRLPVTAADVRAELAQVDVDDETEAGGTLHHDRGHTNQVGDGPRQSLGTGLHRRNRPHQHDGPRTRRARAPGHPARPRFGRVSWTHRVHGSRTAVSRRRQPHRALDSVLSTRRNRDRARASSAPPGCAVGCPRRIRPGCRDRCDRAHSQGVRGRGDAEGRDHESEREAC